jgi:biotin carboxylase
VKRVLLFTTTTGYQTRAFEDAARATGVELVYATDHCHRLDDPWRDGAVPVKFTAPERSTRAIVEALRGRAIDGVLAVGDGPALLAAHAAEALGVPWHSPAGAAAAHDKLAARGRLMMAGLPVPWFVSLDVGEPVARVADRLRFPCVVKPAALSASRGVMRADTPDALDEAIERLTTLLRAPDVVALRDPALTRILVEGFIPGREYALEGVMDRGSLHVLAIFDKPDPLDGPYFEETIYVTPPMLGEPAQRAMAGTIAHAALALGLRHGPVHAECRINEHGVFVLEIAARPIGGLCARSLRFVSADSTRLSLEELLLRQAAGEPLDGCAREPGAAGVMMIPVPGRGRFHRVEGIEDARGIEGIEDIVITAKPGQLLEPWPEGHSYPGFIFVRAPLPERAVRLLRDAHARLRFVLDRSIPLAPRAVVPPQP